jgi:glycosidase
MRYFEDYCEVHLDPNLPPHRWLFRPGEVVRVEFGVALSRHPERGEVWVESNDDSGNRKTKWLAAHPTRDLCNGYLFFSLTLPPLTGGCYRYWLGFRDRAGAQHQSGQSRFLCVSDVAPRSIEEVDHGLLGVVRQRPVYGPKPQRAMTASPADWTGRLFYSIIIDRFACDGDSPRTRLGAVPYDPADPSASHGGSLRGATARLEYLKQLGVSAVILSPVYTNDQEGYHGYHPIHLLMVDPRLGTLGHLREFVDQAHALGMAVILDVVNNHLPDLIDWEFKGEASTGEFKYLRGKADALLPYPVEARNAVLFHGPEHTDLINQRLFGFLEDWRTETDYVRELLIRHLKYWIATADIDGFRYDAVRHIGLDFWTACVAEVECYAEQLGKRRFLQIAEHAGSTPGELFAYNPAKFTNLLDYPTYYTVASSVQGSQPLNGLSDYFCGQLAPKGAYPAGWRNNLMFLDNHDRSRIFHYFLKHQPNREQARACLHLALACLILGPEIPMLYYGTEQEFCGALGDHFCESAADWVGHDYYVREDMFDNPACTWKFGPVNRPAFAPYSTEHATFQLIARLAALRAKHGKLFSEGTRMPLGGNGGNLRHLLIHIPNDPKPLLAVLNLGEQAMETGGVVLPEWHGGFRGIEVCVAAEGAMLHLVSGQVAVRLPAYGFAVGQLRTSALPFAPSASDIHANACSPAEQEVA